MNRALAHLTCVLAVCTSACSGGATETGEARQRLELEVTATTAGLEHSDVATFELDAQRTADALQAVARVDEELVQFEDAAAFEDVRVRIVLDGEPLLERRIPLDLAADALTMLDTFAGSLAYASGLPR